jgi:hypothetical protein
MAGSSRISRFRSTKAQRQPRASSTGRFVAHAVTRQASPARAAKSAGGVTRYGGTPDTARIRQGQPPEAPEPKDPPKRSS